MRRSGGLHGRAFDALLRLYPRAFREAYGEEMRQFFRSRVERAEGRGAMMRLWLRTLADGIASMWALWRSRGGPGGKRASGWLRRDLRHAARQLLRSPVFTFSAVILLAVGIGANTAVFTVVDALLLRPPPYDRPDEVVYVYQDSDDGAPSSSSFPAYRQMAESSVFAAVAATSSSAVSWERAEGPADAVVEYTTASYMDVLGLRVSRGRWFRPEDDVVGNAPVAVVSAATWRARMGGDRSVLGSTIRLNGQPVTIVGVGPERMNGTYAPIVTDFWLSISATPVGGAARVANLERREDHWYDVRARLAPGVGVEQAQAAMGNLASAMAEAYPELDRGREITVFRARDVRIHPGRDEALFSSAAIFAGIVAALLLLACANLANLLLARGMGRSGEMAVRRALGAGPGSVAGLILWEALLLSVAGGALGVLLARWALSALDSVPLPSPLSTTMDLPLDWRVVTFALVLMTLSGIIAGLAPAVRSARQPLAGVLRDHARNAAVGRTTVRMRNALVAIQVGASLVLVVAAGLLGRSLAALQDVNSGMDADRVGWIRTSYAQAGLDAGEAAFTMEQVRARLEALPGVRRAAAASRLPAQRSGTTTTLVEGYTPQVGTNAVELSFTMVTPEYFETVGLALIAGRAFSPTDAPGAERVAIINESAARRFWGGVDPVGRRLRSQSQPDVYRTVVGVVSDAPVNSVSDGSRPMFYGPAAQAGIVPAYLLVRTDGRPEAVLPLLGEEMRGVRASLPTLSQGTLESHLHAALAGPRFAARLMGVVSIVAMLLAGLGTYAVVAFGVARRADELGIRMALGARRGQVVRMVMAETAGTVVLGLAAGLVVAALAAPRLRSVLFGVGPLDPMTFAGALVLLVGVAALAAWMPARRAAGADPLRSLGAR